MTRVTSMEVLARIKELVEIADWSESLPETHGTSVRSGIFTSWTWLSNYYIKNLGGDPWKVEPMILDDHRWEYGPDGDLTTEKIES